MLVELITPLMIATAPTAVIVQDVEKYSHETQIVARANTKDELSLTINGTQTFGPNGRPMDSDAD